jgi:hypothetical protein
VNAMYNNTSSINKLSNGGSVEQYNPIYQNRAEIYSQPIDCPYCKQIVMAEFEPVENLTTLYDFDSYTNNVKILRQHSADARTRDSLLKRVAAEKRLLEHIDPDDYHYNRRKRKE